MKQKTINDFKERIITLAVGKPDKSRKVLLPIKNLHLTE